jgi:transcriptional regulator with XRE-family HTH domain
MKIITPREKDLSNQVVAFLRDHPLISVHQLEKKLGVSQNSISRTVRNEQYTISPKHIFGIIRELAGYGLTIDGCRIEASAESHTIFMEKDVGECEIEEVNEGAKTYFIYKQPQYRSVAGDLLDLL